MGQDVYIPTRLYLSHGRNNCFYDIFRIVEALTRNVDRDAYNKRIRNAEYKVQIVKLADFVHNCSELNSDLPEKLIMRKITDCESLYLGLAQKICKPFYDMLLKYLAPYRSD